MQILTCWHLPSKIAPSRSNTTLPATQEATLPVKGGRLLAYPSTDDIPLRLLSSIQGPLSPPYYNSIQLIQCSTTCSTAAPTAMPTSKVGPAAPSCPRPAIGTPGKYLLADIQCACPGLTCLPPPLFPPERQTSASDSVSSDSSISTSGAAAEASLLFTYDSSSERSSGKPASPLAA